MFDRQTQYGTDPSSRGAANAQALTMPFDDRVSPEVFESFGAEYDTMDTESHPATGGSPLLFAFILIGLIVSLWIIHQASPLLARETFGVNWLSWFQVGIMATFFIYMLKAVFGRWQVRGITPAVAAL